MLGFDAQRRQEGEHRGQREAVVEARLEVERVAHQPRHARVGDDVRGQHRVGRREQRAEQQRLGPASARSSRCAATATIPAVSGIAIASLRSGRCHALCSISPSTSRPSRKRITISATNARSSTNPDCALEADPLEAAVSDHEAGEHEHRRQRQERALRKPGGERPHDQERAEKRGGSLEARHAAPRTRPHRDVWACRGGSAGGSARSHTFEIPIIGGILDIIDKLSAEAVARWRQKTGSARRAKRCLAPT